MKVIDLKTDFVVYVFVALFAVGVFLLVRADWLECRRVHPLWYCLSHEGR